MKMIEAVLIEIVTMEPTKFYSALAFAFVFTVIVPAVIIRFKRAY